MFQSAEETYMNHSELLVFSDGNGGTEPAWEGAAFPFQGLSPCPGPGAWEPRQPGKATGVYGMGQGQMGWEWSNT